MVSAVGFLMVSVVARNFLLWFLSLFSFCFMVSGCYRTAALSPMEATKKHQDVSVTNYIYIYIVLYIYIYRYIYLSLSLYIYIYRDIHMYII